MYEGKLVPSRKATGCQSRNLDKGVVEQDDAY